ncbi:MAG: RNA polymerase sigma factor [Bacteroidota bacterium]
MEKHSDQEILAFIRNPVNMEYGFRCLLANYQERLYWHIRRMAIDHEDANDILQNVLLKVYRSIANFRGDAQLFTWLYRIATNETLTFLNKKQKKSTVALESELTNLEEKLKADPYFDGSAVQLELQKALAQLPEKQRLVFNMRYFEELSYKEISEILETSVGALKASYHHAAKKIEAYVKANVG